MRRKVMLRDGPHTYCATGEMDGEHEVWAVGADEGTTP